MALKGHRGYNLMFGSELAHGEVSWEGRLYYTLLGHDHMGIQVRSVHVRKKVRELPSPARILDAGCGEGCYSFWFARHYPEAKVSGIDLDADLIRKSNLIQDRLAWPNLTFEQEDLRNPHKSSEGYDLICLIDVLEHIQDDESALRNLRKALSPDGCLLVHVPSLDAHECWPFLSVVRDQPDHVRDGYTELELISKLKRAEIEVKEIRYTFGRFGALSREIYYWLNGLRFWRPLLKLALFPVLISLVYLDSLTFNRDHQGLLLLCRGAK